jgi:hypothetical protein
VKRQGDGGDDGLVVQVQAAGEGVQTREVADPGGLGPIPEPGRVRGVRPEQGGEGADEGGEPGHLGAGRGETGEQRLLAVAEGFRAGEQEPGDAPG